MSATTVNLKIFVGQQIFDLTNFHVNLPSLRGLRTRIGNYLPFKKKHFILYRYNHMDSSAIWE